MVSLETLLCPSVIVALAICSHDNHMEILLQFKLTVVSVIGSCSCFCCLQTTTEKHRMSFPETVDEILDVSEDEGRALQNYNSS